MELAVGRIDGATRRRLEQLSRVESYSPGDPRSIEAYRRATHEFHVLVARLSGSHRLAAAIERLEDESDRMIHLGMEFRDRSETVRLGHQKLLAALVAGDVAAIRRLAFEGIQAAERVVRDALLASPVLRATPLGSAAPGGRAVARR
jgi:DNA-binding GntR family transcriptional regulator